MPYRILQEAQRQHVYPRPYSRAALVVIGRGQHLKQQVVDSGNAVYDDIVYYSIRQPQRRGDDIHHHRDDLRHHPPRRLRVVRRPVFHEEIAPGRHEEVLQPVEEIYGGREEVIGADEYGPEHSSHFHVRDAYVQAVHKPSHTHYGGHHQSHDGASTAAAAKDDEEQRPASGEDACIYGQLEDVLPQGNHQYHTHNPEDGLDDTPHTGEERRYKARLFLHDVAMRLLGFNGIAILHIAHRDVPSTSAVVDDAPFVAAGGARGAVHGDHIIGIQQTYLAVILPGPAPHVELRRRPAAGGIPLGCPCVTHTDQRQQCNHEYYPKVSWYHGK